jgi:hypothetical protein
VRIRETGKNRRLEIDNPLLFGTYRKIGGFEEKNQLGLFLVVESEDADQTFRNYKLWSEFKE